MVLFCHTRSLFPLVAAPELEQNPDTKETFMMYSMMLMLCLQVFFHLFIVSDSFLLKDAVLFDLDQFKMLK